MTVRDLIKELADYDLDSQVAVIGAGFFLEIDDLMWSESLEDTVLLECNK